MEEPKKITSEEAYHIRKQMLRSYPDFDDLPWQFRTNKVNWRQTMHLAASLRRFADFLDFLDWEELPDAKDETILKANKLPILIEDFDLDSEDNLNVTVEIHPRCVYDPSISKHFPPMDMRICCEFHSDGKDRFVVDADDLPDICKGEKIAETVAAFFSSDDYIPYDDSSDNKDSEVEFRITNKNQNHQKLWTDIKRLVELRVNRLEYIFF